MIADTAGKSSCAQHVTVEFAYVRLQGPGPLYAGRHGDEERDRWAGKTEAT